MPIRKIYFQISEKSENYSHRSDLLFETYFITEYFSREIIKHKFRLQNATLFLIHIDSETCSIEYQETFKSLHCYLTGSYQDIDSHSGTARTEKILELLLQAAAVANSQIPGFLSAITDTAFKFRNDTYLNRWVFHKKTIRGIGSAALECELTCEKFILDFIITNKSGEIFKKTILETKPDSLCYHHKFGKIEAKDNSIVIPDRFSGVLFEISHRDLLRVIS